VCSCLFRLLAQGGQDQCHPRHFLPTLTGGGMVLTTSSRISLKHKIIVS
jgi:hypothetical protein